MIVYPKVIVVTNKNDLTSDYLILKLKSLQIPYLRVNSEDITEFDPTRPKMIYFGDTEFVLSKVKSVYYRRVPSFFPMASNANDTLFINRERKHFLEGFYLSLVAKWINPIGVTYLGERKLYQLQIANFIGFKIPKTLVSNDIQKIRAFLKDNQKSIIKPISHGLQVTEKDVFSIYTSTISLQSLESDDGLYESPVLIQDRIPNYRDIRVTIVGDYICSVEIEKVEGENVDWRDPLVKKDYKLHALPGYLIELIKKFNQELGLVYSAMDFILTEDGDYYFLETNPVGEWVWLERILNLPIGERIIHELTVD